LLRQNLAFSNFLTYNQTTNPDMCHNVIMSFGESVVLTFRMQHCSLLNSFLYAHAPSSQMHSCSLRFSGSNLRFSSSWETSMPICSSSIHPSPSHVISDVYQTRSLRISLFLCVAALDIWTHVQPWFGYLHSSFPPDDVLHHIYCSKLSIYLAWLMYSTRTKLIFCVALVSDYIFP
jgi:hypothetical protein